MKRVLRLLLVVLAVPIVAYALLAAVVGRDGVWSTLFGPGNRAPVDFATLVLPDSPNRFLVCPPGRCAARADAESPVYAVPPERLRAAWLGVIEKNGGRLLSVEGEQIEVEVRTQWLRFPDLVTVRIFPQGTDRASAAIYSRSLYGHSDFGVNAARVRAWKAEVETGLAAGT